jgi:hypothetical protein
MHISDAQRDIRRAYVGGGPGVIVSSAVWFAAAWAQQSRGTSFAFTVLFFGGMFIFPVSMLISRLVFRRGKEVKGNILATTTLECTIAMIGGLFAAWLFLLFKPSVVLPLAAIAVGTHYAVFKTVYGLRLFWALGAVVTVIGLFDILAKPIPGGVALAVAITELVFGIILTLRGTLQD